MFDYIREIHSAHRKFQRSPTYDLARTYNETQAQVLCTLKGYTREGQLCYYYHLHH